MCHLLEGRVVLVAFVVGVVTFVSGVVKLVVGVVVVVGPVVLLVGSGGGDGVVGGIVTFVSGGVTGSGGVGGITGGVTTLVLFVVAVPCGGGLLITMHPKTRNATSIIEIVNIFFIDFTY